MFNAVLGVAIVSIVLVVVILVAVVDGPSQVLVGSDCFHCFCRLSSLWRLFALLRRYSRSCQLSTTIVARVNIFRHKLS